MATRRKSNHRKMDWLGFERALRLQLANAQKDLEAGACDASALATVLMTIDFDLGEFTGRGNELTEDYVDRVIATESRRF